MRPHYLLALLLLSAGCQSSNVPSNTMLDAPSHEAHFPINVGATHALGSDSPAISCNSCHGGVDTFAEFDCLGCHAHQDQAALATSHRGLAYDYQSIKCYSCHRDGSVSGSMPTGLIADPAKAVPVTALVPTFAGPVITTFTAKALLLPMTMNHQAKAVDASAFASCAGCHPNVGAGSYGGGLFHASLAGLSLSQPATCTECHLAAGTPTGEAAMPPGFVGPTATAPARSPSSGEMRHDAHLWSGSGPGTTLASPQECAQCHLAPTASKAAHWNMTRSGSSPALFHAALPAAQQPSSCLDCHANSRPAGVIQAPGAPSGGVIQFDHSAPSTLGECTSCHQATVAGGNVSWSGGLYHLPGAAAPSTCLPCHSGERPTDTATWVGTAWKSSPFDYVTNAQGVTHGDGQDCVTCHTGPGTGAWGGTTPATRQNWEAGKFNHATSAAASSTCIACHSTQRADLNTLTSAQTGRLAGFDHSINGSGDCIGCHRATATAGTFTSFATDWQGGKAYPGSTPVGSVATGITVVETALVRAASGLVTGTTSASASYFTNMVHTSTAVPSQLNPGPETQPNSDSCWHCHTHAAGSTKITSYANGDFHGSLTGYSATPGGTVTALAEPAHCLECHTPMLPKNIVGPTGSDLQPMDHSAQFTAAVILGGVSVTGVSQMDCALCHKPPSTALGLKFTDGVFHANIGVAQPTDCTVCHYVLMADSAKADLTGVTKAKILHRSAQVTVQDCQKCHLGALAKAKTGAPAAALFQGGVLHAGLGSAQPSSCNECHSAAYPAGATASNVSYTFSSGGGTGTNGPQWVNHSSVEVTSRDCSACHLADAKASGAAWSKLDTVHKAAPSPAACQGCHGLTNGNGSVQGTKNNLPSGLSDSPTKTTAGTTTGVASTTPAQINHADINVSTKDCNLCHAVPTASTPAGKEWAQGSFHKNVAGSALTMNGTTGRCSTCHIGEKPTAAAFTPSHSAFTATSGTQDCSSCHAYPGKGTATAPNWLGATGAAPVYMTLGGFTILGAGGTQATVTTAKHSTNTSCGSCHTGGTGARKAFGYDHSSTVASCNTCHEAGSDDLSPEWNGATTAAAGAGDTRPYTLTTIVGNRGSKTCNVPNTRHFYPLDCTECHNAPSGLVVGTTGSTYVTTNGGRWAFLHDKSGQSKAACNTCHGPCPKD